MGFREEWSTHQGRERGTSPFLIRREDRGNKTDLSRKGEIKMGDGKRGLVVTPRGEEEGV